MSAGPKEMSELDALRQAVEGFAKALENADFFNVSEVLSQQLCCNGWMCGCQGSTVGGYLAFELRGILSENLIARLNATQPGDM